MDNLLLSLVALLAVLWLVMRGVSRYYTSQMIRTAEELKDLVQRLPIPLTVEQINGTLYGYHMSTKDFVCQGRDLRELAESFRRRYPGRLAHITDAPDAAVLVELKQQLATILNDENQHRQ